MGKSSGRWLSRQARDPYLRRARQAGYRSRAAFKLLEIDAKDRLLRPGMLVVDLGAAPGGWSQVAAAKVRPGGRVVAIDLLEIAPISGVTVLRGDFRDGAALAALAGARADVVLCDVSPSLTGIAATDQARAAELVLAAIEFCRRALKAQGALLVKVFQGGEFSEVMKEVKRTFREVKARKPAASRGESRETYVLARGLLCPAKTA
jgi:23S rRNA (uridine2552-2'-O)-methyltransferase